MKKGMIFYGYVVRYMLEAVDDCFNNLLYRKEKKERQKIEWVESVKNMRI